MSLPMLELEQRLHDMLPSPQRQRRLQWLIAARYHLATVLAEMTCFGIPELPALERQLQLTEDAILSMSPEPALGASLITEYVCNDAALIHARGVPPMGMDCAVCRTGTYGVQEILARLPEEID